MNWDLGVETEIETNMFLIQNSAFSFKYSFFECINTVMAKDIGTLGKKISKKAVHC